MQASCTEIAESRLLLAFVEDIAMETVDADLARMAWHTRPSLCPDGERRQSTAI